jgi:hypothetical protein
MKIIRIISVQFLLVVCLQAQQAGNETMYNPHDLFVEEFNPPAGNLYRSASGVPGPEYWQNSASYVIRATFSEPDTSLTGNVTLNYTNNSPDILYYLWFQLDQNILLPTSRGAATTPYPDIHESIRGGYRIGKVSVTYAGNTYEAKTVISDTRMQVRLSQPLKGKGDQIQVSIDFSFDIQMDGGRNGWVNTKSGTIYQIAQWYPRICVYDDVEGWNTLPYVGQGEFYCEFGDYDYYITAPYDLMIFGSGDLQNPEEVLTGKQITKLSEAICSDKTLTIISAEEAGKPSTRPVQQGTLTWHFNIKNARDVAFCAGKSLVWDAARVTLRSREASVLVMSVYPPESVGDAAWSRSTEYLQQSIGIYSGRFYQYPWNTAVSSAGPIDGMEYPGIIFNDYRQQKASLWFLISHEIGHNWYPMIVGSNERKYMWQDEGLNTYMNYIANELFNKGEYKNASLYTEKDFWASLDYREFMYYKDPLMTVSDAMDIGQHYQYYGKTAYGLNLLRNVITDPERFDYAFKKYTETWAFKHPTPYDFFRSINNGTGEDLDWFWQEWFFSTWKFDQAVTAVNYVDKNPAKGALITIENKERMILPVIMHIVQKNGKTETIQLPVEIWQRGGTWVYPYASQSEIEKVVLDPEGILPDTNRKNNEWRWK